MAGAAFDSGRGDPLAGGLPPADERERLLAEANLGFSGWRWVAARSGRGESLETEVSPAGALLAAVAAESFRRYLTATTGKSEVHLALGTDTRPTGPGLARQALRALLAGGARVDWLGVAASPEALAYAAAERGLNGLLLITASHNPPGHNGFKFAGRNGGVIDPAQDERLRELFLKLWRSESELLALRERLSAVDPRRVAQLLAAPEPKLRSSAAYQALLDRVLAGPLMAEQVRAELLRALEREPLGVVAELNGSARATAGDQRYLEALGVRVRLENAEPGRLAHPILPEGASLDTCRWLLEQSAAARPEFQLGYVPDNDGDRGNLVLLDRDSSRARPLEAQEGFALAVAARLAFLARCRRGCPPAGDAPPAVVVNDPTSGRVDAVAERFGARVFRAEVGEANLVRLAEELEREGQPVAILGEGSNGGNITPPARVRDPLATVLSLVLLARLEGVRRELEERFPAPAGAAEGETSLAALAARLPRWHSTGHYEPRAQLQVCHEDHDRLKSNYERIFERRWPEFAPELSRRLRVAGYRFLNYEGARIIPGPGRREAGGLGGFKVQLLDGAGRERGFLWMRGSRTEPVFRVMADTSAGEAEEHYLLELHRAVLLEADRA